MNVCNILATGFVALTLAACGGGGGKTTEQPQPGEAEGPGNPVPFVMDNTIPHGVWNVASVAIETDDGSVTTFGGKVVIMPDPARGEDDYNVWEYYTPLPTDTTAIQPRALMDVCLVNPPRDGDIAFAFTYFVGGDDFWGREAYVGESISMTMKFSRYENSNDFQGEPLATAQLEYAGVYDVDTLAELNTNLCDVTPAPAPQPQFEPTTTFPVGIWESVGVRDILHTAEPEYDVAYAGSMLITEDSWSIYDQPVVNQDVAEGCYHKAIDLSWSEQYSVLNAATNYRFEFSGSHDGGLTMRTSNVEEGPDDASTWYYVGPVTAESEANFYVQARAVAQCDHEHEGGGA